MRSEHDKRLVEREDSERITYEREVLKVLVADRISALMEELGLRPVDVADRLGKSQAWVSRLLNGRQNLTLNTLAHIGYVLGVRWDPVLREGVREESPAAEDGPLPEWIAGGPHLHAGQISEVGDLSTRVAFVSAGMPPAHFFGGGNVVEWHFMDAVESIELATRPSSSVRILPIGVSADDEAAFSDQSASRDALLEMIK